MAKAPTWKHEPPLKPVGARILSIGDQPSIPSADLSPTLSDVRLDIYVDGSHDPRSGRGGWAFVVQAGGQEIAAEAGGIIGGDNGSAELSALLQALGWIANHAPGHAVCLWSDSVYVVTGCNRWRHIWRSSGWRRRTGSGKSRIRAIPYSDLWIEIDRVLLGNDRVQVEWCKGHADTAGNLRADALAQEARLSRQGGN